MIQSAKPGSDEDAPRFTFSSIADFPWDVKFKKLFFGAGGVFGYWRADPDHSPPSAIMHPIAVFSPPRTGALPAVLRERALTQLFTSNAKGVVGGCHFTDSSEEAFLFDPQTGCYLALNAKLTSAGVAKAAVTGLSDENNGVGTGWIEGGCRPFAFSGFRPDDGTVEAHLLGFPAGFQFGVTRCLDGESGLAAGYVQGTDSRRLAASWDLSGAGFTCKGSAALSTEEGCSSEALNVAQHYVFGWAERPHLDKTKRTACFWHDGRCTFVGPLGKRWSEAHAGAVGTDGVLQIVGQKDGKPGGFRGFTTLVGGRYGADGMLFDLNKCVTGLHGGTIDNAFDVNGSQILCSVDHGAARSIGLLRPAEDTA